MSIEGDVGRGWRHLDDRLLPAIGHASTPLEIALNRLALGVHGGSLSDPWQQSKSHYILRRTGLFTEDMARGDTLISAGQLARLLKNIQSEAPWLAISIGQRWLPGSFSALSNQLLHAPTLGDLLQCLCVGGEFYFPLMAPRMITTDHDIYLVFDDSVGVLRQHHLESFVGEMVMASIVSLSHWLARQAVPWQWKLSYPAPAWAHEYRTLLQADAHFNQPVSCLRLSRTQWHTRLPMASMMAYDVARKESREQAALALQPSLPNYLRHLIRDNLKNLPKQQALAEQLGMSCATFKRRLQEHHLNYQRLVDDVRRTEALILQMTEGLSDEQLAERLNFYDVSNYRRSLRRWNMSALTRALNHRRL